MAMDMGPGNMPLNERRVKVDGSWVAFGELSDKQLQWLLTSMGEGQPVEGVDEVLNEVSRKWGVT